MANAPLVSVRLDGSGWQRAVDPAWTLRLWCDAETHSTRLSDAAGTVLRQWLDPLAALAWMSAHLADLPAREGGQWGWVGYLGYDVGRFFETLPPRMPNDLALPLFHFTLHRLTGKAAAREPSAESASATTSKVLAITSSVNPARFESMVQRAVEFIAAGDVFQVNLSQRLRIERQPHLTPQVIYDRLPATAYAAFIAAEEWALISHSPELFLRVNPTNAEGPRRIITRPIKGTRPRLAGMDRELLQSEKDQAELNMIVDLERNDLGRVCEVGTVRVTQPRTIEAHPTVYHGVATIAGNLRADVSWVDLLRATFPGGSITGAPKIRAMQIIDELEAVRRGPYCGAIGYLAGDGSMEFNVAIRTLIAMPDAFYLHVGGGIVAESNPREEYDETQVKARAMLDAITGL